MVPAVVVASVVVASVVGVVVVGVVVVVVAGSAVVPEVPLDEAVASVSVLTAPSPVHAVQARIPRPLKVIDSKRRCMGDRRPDFAVK